MKPMSSLSMPGRRAFPLAALAMAWMLIAASSTQASTVSIGSPLTTSFTSSLLCNPLCTEALTELPGALVASPSDGTIVRWRVKAAAGPGGFRLQVLHPAGFDTYTGTGLSEVGTPISFGTQVFPASLPVRAGDLIGLDNTDVNEKVGIATTSGTKLAFWGSTFPDGSTLGPDFSGATTVELAFNADIQPLPGISSLSPSSGPIGGGAAVTIGGHDFTGATAVSFGSVPAASFTVDSDGQVTAVSPRGSRGTVDVSIKNPGQTPIVATDKFTYTACVTPNLKHKTLKKAKEALKKAGCRLGTAKGVKSKSAKVKKQNPKPGKVLAPGAKVNVKLD
jgi:hypothetical protein